MKRERSQVSCEVKWRMPGKKKKKRWDKKGAGCWRDRGKNVSGIFQTGRHGILIDHFSGKVCIWFNPDKTQKPGPRSGLEGSLPPKLAHLWIVSQKEAEMATYQCLFCYQDKYLCLKYSCHIHWNPYFNSQSLCPKASPLYAVILKLTNCERNVVKSEVIAGKWRSQISLRGTSTDILYKDLVNASEFLTASEI